ncbi:MAG: DUF1573 domain-containing protein [Deltaproteobacteria bacterium]|nr:DUF1573 domain-containing protein [Deltaproteobacteria bacterium]
MKKYFNMVLACAFVSLFFGHFALARELQGPKMFLEELKFDFGEVKEGVVVSHTFRVLNQGDQPLEIRKVKPG